MYSRFSLIHFSSLVPYFSRFLIPGTTEIEEEENDTRAVQWETGKIVLKIVCRTDVIVCRVCKDGDLELPINGICTPAARIGTWETVRQDGGALATVHQARAAKCCEIFV
jgi:hypothetical protein